MLAGRAGVMVGVLAFALASFAASPQPVGMLNSAGSDNVAVGGVTVPGGTALYKGDTIQTASGYARFTLSGGAGFIVNPNSKVRLTGTQSVELVKGMSRIESRGGELTLVASAWALTPSPDSKTGRLSADVVVEDSGRVSVNVSEGRLTATNKATKEVAVAQLGRPVLLPAAAAPSPAPQPPSGTPSAGGRSNAKVIGAYVVGITAAAVGITALATRETGVSKSDFAASQAQLTQISSQLTQMTSANTALSAQITSLNAQITSLRATVASSATYGQQVQAALAQLVGILASLQTAQSSLAANQNAINSLVAQVAQGIPLNATQLAQLQTLQAQQATLSGQIATLASQAATVSNQLRGLTPPNSPTSP